MPKFNENEIPPSFDHPDSCIFKRSTFSLQNRHCQVLYADLLRRGGLIAYTKGYAIRETSIDPETKKETFTFIKFLNWNKKREVKNIWKTLGIPQIMITDW